ncbi:hypothetical protein IIA16_02145 [bacterium]|nr:hypothetical protein [bacterium]
MARPDSRDHHRKWAEVVSRLAGQGDSGPPPAPTPRRTPPPEAAPPDHSPPPERREPAPRPRPEPREQPTRRSPNDPKGVLGWLAGLLGGGNTGHGQPRPDVAGRPRRGGAREPDPAPVLHDFAPVDADIRREVLAYREDGHVVAEEGVLCRILAERFWRDADTSEQKRLCDEALNGLAREGAIQRFAVGDTSMCYLKFR